MTTLDEDIPMPKETKAKPRARRKKEIEVKPAKALLDALKFIKPAQKKRGTPQEQHCMIVGNWLAASNEVLTIAVKIEEDLSACPQSFQFEEALKKTGSDLSIVQLSETSISVTSGVFKAIVPCLSLHSNELLITPPDEISVAIKPSALIDAFKILLPVVSSASAPSAVNATHSSVLLEPFTAVASNGYALVEYCHGIDLPCSLMIPKLAVSAVLKSNKVLLGLGYSTSSVTFWFEDGSFIKTQLYEEKFPNYQQIFECENLNPWVLPDEFYIGVKSIKAFTRNGIVFFEQGRLASNELESEASTYTIAGLPEGMGFDCNYLLMFEKGFDKVYFDEENNKAFFFGENVRGVTMAIKPTVNLSPPIENTDADDKPF